MRVLTVLLPLVLALTAQAQPVPDALSTVKRVYTLVVPTDADAPAVGALTRTEFETYGHDGRRLRVEWRSPADSVVLSFMELYDASARPFGAVYFEGTDLDPTLEKNEYRDGAIAGQTVKRVSYIDAEGAVTTVNEFVSDARGREVERRYGVADSTPRAVDTITYDGPNATGYVYARTDGSSRSEYVYRTESVDDRGNWTSRVVLRDGVSRTLETRTIEYRD